MTARLLRSVHNTGDPSLDRSLGDMSDAITALQQQLGQTTYAHGALVNVQSFTASGMYTPTRGATWAIVEIQGDGGGSGGAGSGSSGVAMGAGGSSGVYLVIRVLGGLTGGPVSIGAGGSAGTSNGSTPGGAGSGTSITISGQTYTANGGGGGNGMTNASGNKVATSSAPSAGSSTGLYSTYQVGDAGIALGGTTGLSGRGGSSPFGGGGVAQTNAGIGSAGTGYGSAGSGAAATTVGKAGVQGQPGLVVVWEYA